MNRPLETTFWMRFKQFLKGAFLYNTIYWRRASDDLDIKRMSREERASLRPVRNLDIIRPRENPRPLPTSVLTLPPEVVEQQYVPAAAEARTPAQPSPARAALESAGEDDVQIHRRKKRRRSRHSQVMPKKYYEAGGGGIMGWLFRR